MPKKDLIQKIIKAAEAAGIQMDQASKDLLADRLEAFPMVLESEAVPEGYVQVKESNFTKIREDMLAYKQESRDLKDELADLKDKLASGEGTLKKMYDDLKTKADNLDALNQKLLTEAEGRWNSVQGSIPEKLQKQFHLKGEDDPDDWKPSTDQLLHNLSKFDEYSGLGLLKDVKPTKGADPPVTPPGKQPDPDKWQDLPAKQQMQKGYGSMDRTTQKGGAAAGE